MALMRYLLPVTKLSIMTQLRKYILARSTSFIVSTCHQSSFVPEHKPANDDDVHNLKKFVSGAKSTFVLTGAGISTESGIPDYRSEGVGLYARSKHKPVQYQEFVKSKAVRKRYWARNFVAWPRFSSHEPNIAHSVIAMLQKRSVVGTVVTMNVDGLHRKAFTSPLIELHGSAYEVVCLDCGDSRSRHQVQEILRDLNPSFPQLHLNQDVVRPDGDINLPKEFEDKFITASCDKCGGDLIPNIVFFGDNVPPKRAKLVEESMDQADALLILGSSVSTYSAYRICLQAVKSNKPIAIVNIGQTRADKLASLKIEAKCGDVVPHLLD